MIVLLDLKKDLRADAVLETCGVNLVNKELRPVIRLAKAVLVCANDQARLIKTSGKVGNRHPLFGKVCARVTILGTLGY